MRTFLVTAVLAIVSDFGLNIPIQAAFINLDTLGAAHAHSGGNAATFRAFAFVPNAAGNFAFAGAWAFAAGPPGAAFGAGSGYAARPGANALFLDAEIRVALAPGAAPGILHAWAVGYADPAPNPFLNPLDNSQLSGIFGEPETVTDVPSQTQTEYNSTLAEHPVTDSSPGVDGDASLTITLDPTTHQLSFDFSGNILLDTSHLATYSDSLSLNSDELGIHRSFSYDESGQPTFQGGWGPSNLQVTHSGTTTELNLDQLSFTIPVSPDYNLQSSDFILESIGTAVATPEPSAMTLFGTGLLGLFGYGWRRRKPVV